MTAGELARTRRVPGNLGRGLGRSLDCPRPPGRSEPPASLPRRGQTKDRRPVTRILSPAPEGRSRGSLYPAPRRCAALRVPGPRLRTDGPPDNGPRAAARAGQAGLSGTGPRQAEGSCGPSRGR